MRVIIEGAPKEGKSTLAQYLFLHLRSKQFPAELHDKCPPPPGTFSERLEAIKGKHVPVEIEVRCNERNDASHLPARLERFGDEIVVKGTLVSVEDICNYIDEGYDMDALLKHYPELEKEDVDDVMDFAGYEW